jgi:hypothetical protein
MKRTVDTIDAAPSVGGLTITKVVKEHIPLTLPREGYGETFGQVIDAHLDDCLVRGDVVQSFTIEINEEYWMNKLRRHFE